LSEVEKTGLLVKKDNSQISNNQFPTRLPDGQVSKQIPNSNDQNLKQVTDYQLPVTSYYDRFRDRITFPIADLMGKVIGFSARVSPGGDESQAKYVNTPETAIYHKSKIFYGIDKAKKEIKEKDEVILVEGNTDVIAAHQAGAKNTVAVSGTALTPDQLDIIKRYTQNIKMFFDMDSAGQSAALRSAELALEKGLNVYIVESGAGKDAAEIISKDPDIFTQALKNAKPAMEYFLKQIFAKFNKNNPMDKKEIASEGLELVRYIGNEIEKNHWLKIIAEELDVDFRVLADNLEKREKKEKGFEKKTSTEEEFIGEERLDVIIRKIIGLMLAYPKVWKQIAGEYADDVSLASNSEFRVLVRSGESCNFEIDKLLVIMDDEDLRKTFQKLAFENRYRFSEDTGVEESDVEKAIETARSYLEELEKEAKKKKMKNIMADIKKAEKEGNKEAVKILTGEFTNLSKDLK
jgi:DNA primase